MGSLAAGSSWSPRWPCWPVARAGPAPNSRRPLPPSPRGSCHHPGHPEPLSGTVPRAEIVGLQAPALSPRRSPALFGADMLLLQRLGRSPWHLGFTISVATRNQGADRSAVSVFIRKCGGIFRER